MCGRGGLDYSWAEIWNYLNLIGDPPPGGLKVLNLAPSLKVREAVKWSRVPVVLKTGRGREIRPMIWPLVPVWAKGELPKYATANCRSESNQRFSETVAKKPAFRNAWLHGQRCLVPFSWFYEWDQRSKPKQPWRVLPATDSFLIFAGLWETSSTADEKKVESFTIVTTEPNGLLRDIGHHRAPVILERDEWDLWLSGPKEEAENLLKPPPEGSLRAHQVTTRVNNPGYQEQDLLEAQA